MKTWVKVLLCVAGLVFLGPIGIIPAFIIKLVEKKKASNDKEKCKNDGCISETLNFIKIIHTYENMDVPTFTVSFEDDSIKLCFVDTDTSRPCILMNMFHKGQVTEEDTINQLIGEAIHADELPEETTVEWHFDDSNNQYDYYVLRLNVTTEHKRCVSTYMEYIKTACERNNYKFVCKGLSLHFFR